MWLPNENLRGPDQSACGNTHTHTQSEVMTFGGRFSVMYSDFRSQRSWGCYYGLFPVKCDSCRVKGGGKSCKPKMSELGSRDSDWVKVINSGIKCRVISL